MKILFFADIHSDGSAIRHIAKKAKKWKVDALVCAGDLSEFGEGLEDMVHAVDLGMPFYIIPGNHESPVETLELSDTFKWVEEFDLKTVKIGDVLLIGCGRGGFSHELERFDEKVKDFKKEIKKFKNKKNIVLVTHAPPYNTKLDKIFGEHTGVRSLRKFIKEVQPGLMVCGHLHENSGKVDYIGKTKIINPGKKGFLFKS